MSQRPAEQPTDATPPDDAFTQSFAASDWAEAFVKRVRANPDIATDVSTMLGWFANAIMRGYDEHARRAAVGGTPTVSDAEQAATFFDVMEYLQVGGVVSVIGVNGNTITREAVMIAVNNWRLLASRRTSTGQAPSVIGDVREAWLLAANVASIVRDEYYARSQEEGLSPVQRERYTYASTVAKQIKGEILAYAGIQEWPAPKPLAGNGGERASSDNSVATEPLSKTALSGSESTSSVVQPFQSLDELNRFALLNSEATPKWSDTPILAHTGFARMLATARERFSVNTTAGQAEDSARLDFLEQHGRHWALPDFCEGSALPGGWEGFGADDLGKTVVGESLREAIDELRRERATIPVAPRQDATP